MNKKILVIDDDPELNELLRGYLSNNGYTVETAFDGSCLLHLLDNFQPDLLILDLMLPGVDGLTPVPKPARQFALAHPDADCSGR